jgi:tetratricopeptide (TPR) repeat protein
MRRYLFLLFIILSPSIKTIACLQESSALINGKLLTSTSFRNRGFVPEGPYFWADSNNFLKALYQLDTLWKTKKNIDNYSDYGVVLVYLGKYEEALRVFTEIEKLKPGTYANASNLGTTYELLGQNHQAWAWIKKALKINPASHENSEWLHLKILDAKIKGEQYFTTRFFLGTGFGDDTIPKSRLPMERLTGLRDALYYQLNERISFVKPKDKIMALLLFELGNICAIINDDTPPLALYQLAKDYGYSSVVLDKRYAKFKLLNTVEYKESTPPMVAIKTYTWLWWAAGGSVLLLILAMIIWKKKRK